MAYFNKIERIEPGIATARRCITSAWAADAAIKNPFSYMREDEGYMMQGNYSEIEDMPQTTDKARLAEYKLNKLCEGLTGLIKVASAYFIPKEIMDQISSAFNDYLNHYPMITHEFIHRYMRGAQAPSETLKALDETALASEAALLNKVPSLAKLFDSEVGYVPKDKAFRLISDAVGRMLPKSDEGEQ